MISIVSRVLRGTNQCQMKPLKKKVPVLRRALHAHSEKHTVLKTGTQDFFFFGAYLIIGFK